MIKFSKDMMEVLAGLSDPNDRFYMDEERPESVFHGAPDEAIDEVTARRLGRASHLKVRNSELDEAPGWGQLGRRRVAMHEPNAAVREPQSYLADPQFEEPEESADLEEPRSSYGLSLYDVIFGDDDVINYGFGTDFEELEAEYEEATPNLRARGYGYGRQTGRYPGFGARSAGYIGDKSE